LALNVNGQHVRGDRRLQRAGDLPWLLVFDEIIERMQWGVGEAVLLADVSISINMNRNNFAAWGT